MRKVRYVELCAGIGGMRAGLDGAGWKCLYALDVSPEAVNVHRRAFGDCELGDVSDLDPADVPAHDVLVSGFPCQPFSTSGDKKGFHHRSGNVFENVMRIVAHHRSPVVLLENVEGLLSNRFGHSMATILRMLTRAGYVVEWLTTDAAWFSIPQTRPRVIVIARREELFASAMPGLPPWEYSFIESSSFSRLLAEVGAAVRSVGSGSLDDVIRTRAPRVGMAKPVPSTVFAGAGVAMKGKYYTYRVLPPQLANHSPLGDICCPKFAAREVVRSVRYYARGGPTLPFVRREPVAHCLGTNIGAAPTFAVPLELIKTSRDRDAVLEYANWRREQAGYQIFRLVPDRALLLFGPHVARLRAGLLDSGVTITSQYVLIGNIVSPSVALAVARCVEQVMSSRPSGATNRRGAVC